MLNKWLFQMTMPERNQINSNNFDYSLSMQEAEQGVQLPQGP